MENETGYEVFFLGELKAGVSRDEATRQLMSVFKLSQERAEKMLSSGGLVVKRNLTRERAEKFVAVLDRIGLLAETRGAEPALELVPEPQQPVAEPEKEPVDFEATVVIAPNAGSDDAEAEAGAVQQGPPHQEPSVAEPQAESSSRDFEATVVMAPKGGSGDGAVPKVPATAGEDEYRDIQVNFSGQGFEYFKIWIVNIFLTIITLGIYSAWAKVRNTRYFYGNTEIDGSSFEYTANPVDILKGRVIAVVFFVVYAGINEFMPLLGLVMFALLLGFIPWIVVRSLAFTARNSLYRNIRFNFVGTTRKALPEFVLWPMLIPFSLGLVLPHVWYRQRRFIIGNYSYGTSRFDFHAKSGDYYRVFFVLFGILIGGAALAAVVAFMGEMLHPMIRTLAGPLVFFALYIYLFAYHSAAMANLQFNSTTLASHGFSMDQSPRAVAWIYFTNTLGIVLTLGLFIPWAQVRLARYRASRAKLHVMGSLDHFIAEEQQQVSALGDQVGDVFDMGVSAI